MIIFVCLYLIETTFEIPKASIDSLLAYMSLFRLPRLLRFYNLAIFFDRLDQNLPFPLLIRLTRTVNTMVYLVHIAGCAYYGFSKFEGIGSTSKNYTVCPEIL